MRNTEREREREKKTITVIIEDHTARHSMSVKNCSFTRQTSQRPDRVGARFPNESADNWPVRCFSYPSLTTRDDDNIPRHVYEQTNLGQQREGRESLLPKHHIGVIRIQRMGQFGIVIVGEQHLVAVLSVGNIDV